MDEEMSTFKSYLRQLLRRLKDLKEAHEAGDNEKVSRIIQELLDDTQSGIED